MEFWTEPQMASIHKMLNPRSIAIVGATPRMQYGGRFLAAALKAKDRIRVYAVGQPPGERRSMIDGNLPSDHRSPRSGSKKHAAVNSAAADQCTLVMRKSWG